MIPLGFKGQHITCNVYCNTTIHEYTSLECGIKNEENGRQAAGLLVFSRLFFFFFFNGHQHPTGPFGLARHACQYQRQRRRVFVLVVAISEARNGTCSHHQISR